MNIKALQKALNDVLKSCFLTSPCEKEVRDFIENGDLGVFSNASRKELSFLYSNIISPSYSFYSGGEYLPNIFVELEDE